jgi:hypothetical protein
MNSRERQFLKVMRKLDAAGQEQVVAFAEFMRSRQKPEAPQEKVIEKPNLLPAREGESVVGAIKRLRESYIQPDVQACHGRDRGRNGDRRNGGHV